MIITPKEAYSWFKKKHKSIEPKEAGLYKERLYIFVAPESEDVDFNDPYYAIDGVTGAEVPFSPVADILGFQDAMVNHPVVWR